MLPGTVGAWLAAYKAEMTEVSTRRFADVSPQEKARVLAHETVIRLMMSSPIAVTLLNLSAAAACYELYR